MRRDELEIGGLYVGPNDRCYEVVDTEPGWRMTPAGGWSRDVETRTRYMPGRGEMHYRANVAIRVYIHEDGKKRRGVIDPRKLTQTWQEFQAEQDAAAKSRKHAESVARASWRVVRTLSGAGRVKAGEYRVSPDGSTVTVPTEELALLTGVSRVSPAEAKGSTKISWSSP